VKWKLPGIEYDRTKDSLDAAFSIAATLLVRESFVTESIILMCFYLLATS
jgi:hypothetical protein